MSHDYVEPPPRDHSLTRAQRRRLERGEAEEQVAGIVGCKFCKSTVGQYFKHGNHFNCRTAGCKGNKGIP